MTATTTRRGTSNSNSRGSSKDRAARRAFLMTKFADRDGVTRCHFCGMPLQNDNPKAADYITVDRIIPGAQGGRYVRDNIRPADMKCNSEDGGKIAAGYRKVVQVTTVAI